MYQGNGDISEDLREWGTERDIRREALRREDWEDEEVEIYREDTFGYRRVPRNQKIRGGIVQARKRIEGSGKAKIELDGQEVEIPASTVAEVEEWLRENGEEQEYTFWRGMWQLGPEDWLEDETVRMFRAEETEELCCGITIGNDYMEVLPRNVTELYRQIAPTGD
jgi:hypothetical protein